MIPVTRKVPPEKQLIKLPDKLVEEIDRRALGIYSSRSEFLNEAIHTFARDRILADRKLAAKYKRTYKGNGATAETIRMSRANLWKLSMKLSRYESDDYTPVTAYITAHQLEIIRTCFLFKDGPLKTLQDFARLAAVMQLEAIDEEEEHMAFMEDRWTLEVASIFKEQMDAFKDKQRKSKDRDSS